MRRALIAFAAGLVCVALGLLVGFYLGRVGVRRALLPARLMPTPMPTRTPSPSPTPRPTATPTPTPTPTVTPTPTPTPVPLPENFIPRKTVDTGKLFNGLQVETRFETKPGGIASVERETPNSFEADITLTVKVPAPARKPEEVAADNPDMLKVLPKLSTLLSTAKVSGFYHGLYARKTQQMQQHLKRLDQIMTRGNFFDCQTVLELQDPQTGRKALLVQANMDTDTDGSDPDRWNDVDTGGSASFQPFTSYKWPRQTNKTSPYVAAREERIRKLQSELGTRAAAGRLGEIRQSIAALRDEIQTLKSFSFLIGKADPYVVLPSFFTKQGGGGYQPKIGDYVVVIAGKNLYPAIVGDFGPNAKIGEASWRIAREVNAVASGTTAAAEDLRITYLVFPNTAEQPFGPPDYAKLQERLTKLLGEIGGTDGTAVQTWANIIPTPTPTPTPMPTPTPKPTITPTPVPVTNPTPVFAPTPTPTPTPTPRA